MVAVPRQGLVKINLGCGLAVSKGWLNVDGSLSAFLSNLPSFTYKLAYKLSGANSYYTLDKYCEILRDCEFVHHDLAFGIPFPDDSVDYIYTSHFLEHLDKAVARNLLEESFRVLRLGGIMRISVPDLDYAIRLYSEGNHREMLDDYFFVEERGNSFSVHRYMYNFQMLRQSLSEIGFSRVNRKEFQRGDVPDTLLLDNRPECSLFIEAVKSV